MLPGSAKNSFNTQWAPRKTNKDEMESVIKELLEQKDDNYDEKLEHLESNSH